MAKLTAWLTLAVLVVISVWAGYRATRPDTFSRELVMSGLGAVLTVLSGAAVAFVALFSDMRRMNEARALRRFEGTSWLRQSLRVGRMEIPGVVVIASGNAGRPWTAAATLEFRPLAKRRILRDEVKAHIDTVLAEMLEQARQRGATLTDDLCVDVVEATVELRRAADGRRHPCYVLTPAEASYFDFLGSTANLDARVTGSPTLRELADIVPQGLSDVSGLPAMAKAGSGTAVVTRDGRLVLGVRGRTAVAGRLDARDARSMVHVVAEGVVPSDLGPAGTVDPRATA